ncbi:MAG: hypothetical protein RL685_2808 [Pseudomonadota bacterium]|jgi:hypothetical protein
MKGLQLLAIVSVALLLGTTFTHVLQMPSDLALPDPLWWRAQHSPEPRLPMVGGPLELLTVGINLAVLTAALSRPHYLFLSAGSALCLVGAFFVWVVFTEPVDVHLKHWLNGSLSPDAGDWRQQWEFSQLVRLLLHLAALLLLAASLLHLPLDERPERGIAHG